MLENGNFDLQKCIDYFVNHLRVKKFIKINQNTNPKIKIGYYDLGGMHKESNQRKTRKKKRRKFISMSNHFIQAPLIHII